MNFNLHFYGGYSYIKFAILLGLLAILLLILLPGYQDDTIRNKVTQGLKMVEPARNALVSTCNAKSDAVVSRNSQAGYAFFESMYVADVRLSADCNSGEMEVLVKLQNTGADTDPEIVLMSESGNTLGANPDAQNNDWSCFIARGQSSHVPGECRTKAPSSTPPLFTQS